MSDRFRVKLKDIRISATVIALAAVLVVLTSESQTLTPDEISSFRNVVGSRVEAVVVLAGDQGMSAGNFSQTSSGTDRKNVDLNILKFGGVGDVGDPMPLGDLPLNWQPRLQGSMGYGTSFQPDGQRGGPPVLQFRAHTASASIRYRGSPEIPREHGAKKQSGISEISRRPPASKLQ